MSNEQNFFLFYNQQSRVATLYLNNNVCKWTVHNYTLSTHFNDEQMLHEQPKVRLFNVIKTDTIRVGMISKFKT